ncbi:MAG TPA: hypothetical protein ENI59_00020 [Euryarchaeota archaeon]|nr:hypothetical protein [Euryarchaeota archaeon]
MKIKWAYDTFRSVMLISDKFLHLSASFAAALILYFQTKLSIWNICILVFAGGIIWEFLEVFFADGISWKDLIADLIGIGIFVLFVKGFLIIAVIITIVSYVLFNWEVLVLHVKGQKLRR